MGIQLNTIKGQARIVAASSTETVSDGYIKLTSGGACQGLRLSFLTGYVEAAASGSLEHGPGANIWEQAGTSATIAQSLGVSISAADANANTLTVTAHGLSDGDPVAVYAPAGTMPSNVTSSHIYYAEVIDANTVRLHKYSPKPNGQPVDILDAGSSALLIPVVAHTVAIDVSAIGAPLFGAARARIATGAGDVQLLSVVVSQSE